jgi:hypoxanthine-guanine phosphoribosyltransferase
MKYSQKTLVRIAKRENNTKRNYLVVNPLQGKHVPVSPSKALALFSDLADTIRGKYAGEKLLLIGFAETATAIGAQAAIALGTEYIQTTREVIPGVEYLFFSEEHSHATEQKLVKNDIDEAIERVDRIVFVEDEVTTGKTILNIISVMRKEYSKDIKFAVASILNGMSEEHRMLYEDNAIDLHYLVKTDHSRYGEIADAFAGDGEYSDYSESDGQRTCSIGNADNTHSSGAVRGYVDDSDKIEQKVQAVPIAGRMDARRLVDAPAYEAACRKLCEDISATCTFPVNKRILVVGTEEFMFPALFIGAELEKIGNEVKCHSTTRSPITVSTEEQYPLHARYELRSLYDAHRRTFLYDIDAYDQVYVVTDADMSEDIGVDSLIHALASRNEKITVFRWC